MDYPASPTLSVLPFKVYPKLTFEQNSCRLKQKRRCSLPFLQIKAFMRTHTALNS
jgi:hypothetical protein